MTVCVSPINPLGWATFVATGRYLDSMTSTLNYSPETLQALKVFLDDRFGDHTADLLQADMEGEHTHQELATRYGMARRTVSHRIIVAKTCLRRMSQRLVSQQQAGAWRG
jgi:hypothetical protein